MAVIETKYSIGDTVYHASVTTTKAQHSCPDCGGTKRWKAFSPAGGEYEFACPRCTAVYRHYDDMSLDYSEYVPSIQRLTVGSVAYNSAEGSYDHGARYMCRETGVGSGSVYSEADLYETEAEAVEAGKAKAADSNKNVEWVAARYNRTLSISDHQISNAAMKLAADARIRAGSMLYGLEDLFSSITEADSKDDILELVENYKRYDWERDKKRAQEIEA